MNSQVEEDSNVALNYLEKGVARFPQDARILLEYFRLAPNKNAVIQIVKERNVNDARLISAVIDYLVSVNQWNDVCHFAVQLENGNNLCESEQNYLDLIKAYAGLFSDSPNYSEAQRLLEKVIRTDTDNNLFLSYTLRHVFKKIYRFVKDIFKHDLQTPHVHFLLLNCNSSLEINQVKFLNSCILVLLKESANTEVTSFILMYQVVVDIQHT